MKKSFGIAILPAAVAATMMFAACGSDDNSSNVERAEDSSSSVEATSSSAEASSSSEKRDVPSRCCRLGVEAASPSRKVSPFPAPVRMPRDVRRPHPRSRR